MLLQTFFLTLATLPTLITSMRSIPHAGIARLPTLHRRPTQRPRTIIKASTSDTPSHHPASRAPLYSASAYPQLQQLVNGNYHYAIGYISNGFSTGFPGSVGLLLGLDWNENFITVNEIRASASFSSKYACTAIRELVQADGMIYHETLSPEELDKPMKHFFAAMTPKRDTTTAIVGISRENFPWFPPVFMRLDQGGIWSTKDGMSAPSQIQNSKFDNVDETIEMLLKTAHERIGKFEYEFCGFFEVPEAIQDIINRMESNPIF